MCLLTNIDMSAVTEWTPIGKAAFELASNKLTLTGTPLRRAFQRAGLPHPQPENGRRGQRGGRDIRIVRGFGPGRRGREFLVRHGLFADRHGHGRFVERRGGRNGPRRHRARHHEQRTDALSGHGGSVRITMALIGTAFAETAGVTIDNVNNNGAITAENRDNNTAGGATGYHIAGIVGFSSNDGSSQQKVIISDCINYGDMTSATGRTSGIVAAANRYTQLTNCINHGNQMNTCPKEDAGRLGNITCNMGTGSSMSGCTNYGNLTSTTGARCGGITSISNTATFENCANYGTILSDGSRGVFWAYNNGVAQWTDCTAGGKVGTYNNGAPSSTPTPKPIRPTTWVSKARTNRRSRTSSTKSAARRRRDGRRCRTAHPLHRQQFHERRRGAPARHTESRRSRQGEDDAHVLRRPHGPRVQQRFATVNE